MQVITRWYRAPEVLMGHKFYEQSVDVWSAACIICGTYCVHLTVCPRSPKPRVQSVTLTHIFS